MFGYLRGMDDAARSNAAAKGYLQDAGEPPHVYRSMTQCLIEEVVIYGRVGKHPHRPVSPDSFRDDPIQYDATTAWQLNFLSGVQITESNGHEVDFDEIPPSTRVLARLRLEPFELLEEVTIFSTMRDMEDMAMVMTTDDHDYYVLYPGPLCSAIRLGTPTKRF